MPVGAAIGIAGIATSASTIYSAKTQSGANRDALATSRAANEAALAQAREEFEYDRKRQERLDRLDEGRYAENQSRLDRLEAEDRRRFDLGANFEREQYNNRAVYRAAGKAAIAEIAQLAGLNLGDLSVEQVPLLEAAPAAAARPDTRIAALDPRASQPPAPSILPAPGSDGLIEMRMSPEAYEQLSAEWAPMERRPSRRRLRQTVGDMDRWHGVAS